LRAVDGFIGFLDCDALLFLVEGKLVLGFVLLELVGKICARVD
jgi:hypothetical protein